MEREVVKTSHPYLDEIANQLIAYTREHAKSDELLPVNDKLQHYGMNGDRDAALMGAIKSSATLSPDEKLHAAHALAAERIVLSALGNMYRRMEMPPPEERFKIYFEQGLAGSPESQAAFVNTLKEAQEQMVISIVQTMHPTIYHTAFARENETKLTELLEEVASGYRERPMEKRGEYARRADGPVSEAKHVIKEMVQKLMSGEHSVTPGKQVTVAEENNLDRKNHIKMQKAFDEVVKGYNRALTDVANNMEIKGHLRKDLAEQMRSSRINDEQVTWRTWAYAADADGRDLSTSIILYDGVHHHVKDGKYMGRKRDLRENAKDQKQSVSALIQRAHHKDGDFRDFCDAFLKDHQDSAAGRAGWVDSNHSTVLQLTEKEQADMFRSLITDDFKTHSPKLKDFTLVPDSLEEQTIAFNKTFVKLYQTFLKDKGISTNGTLPDMSILSAAEFKELSEVVAATPIEVGKKREQIFFSLERRDKEPGSTLYYPTTGDNREFFSTARKTTITEKEEGGKTVRTAKNDTMTPKERRKALDVVKRLHVLNDAVDQYGAPVADRYQVANFENASDFYATMLLFKETGIITVKDGKISGAPKLSLQPLLETEQDQRNAIGLFTELLKDPLVRSYYEALGNQADMMVGYSDGSKSAGNLASEWSILKCQRDLKEVFAGHGIELNFLHGRGRGDSRGGQFEEGQNYRAGPYQMHDKMRYDETIQSDGPMNGAISPARGQDTLASIVTGVITAKREATEEKQKRRDPRYDAWMKSLEGTIDEMAVTSRNEYLRLVANHPSTTKLLAAVHDNDYKSSRAKGRKGGEVAFDSLRAITVEYGFNMADAPLHYIGMRKALQEFVDGKKGVQDRNGRTVTGARALEVLYSNNPFFRNMLDKTEKGLEDYDPAVFRQYAKVIGVEPWADECIAELNGLREMVQSVRARDATLQVRRNFDYKNAPRPIKEAPGYAEAPIQGSLAHVARWSKVRDIYEARGIDPLREQSLEVDKAAHAIALSGAYKDGQMKSIADMGGVNPLQPEDATSQDAMRTVAFLVSESNRTKGTHPSPAINAGVNKEPYFAASR